MYINKRVLACKTTLEFYQLMDSSKRPSGFPDSALIAQYLYNSCEEDLKRHLKRSYKDKVFELNELGLSFNSDDVDRLVFEFIQGWG